MKTSVIIVSAGKSVRMNGVDKQFYELSGVPVLIRSITAFDEIDCVSQIIVVTSPERIEDTAELISQYDFSHEIVVTGGGATRQQSVFSGYSQVSDDCELIAIHDGARPLVSPNDIEQTIDNASKYGASVLCVPVKDTIKKVSGGFIQSTPNRNTLVTVQTPQVFNKELFIKGMENALERKLNFTDDCQLVEAVGGKICITYGDYSNIKITTPEDLRLAELLIAGE